MLRLVYLEMRVDSKLHIIWVVGTRQIAAGIYGFSRGCLIHGIALYGSISDFFLLNKTYSELSMSLLPWFWTWVGVNNIEPLTPESWFKEVLFSVVKDNL